MSRTERTELLIGKAGVSRLAAAKVLLFGLGGVGGSVCEALVRAGVGAIDLVDHDTVSESNLNRQIIATLETVGMEKTQVMKQRILSINPACRVGLYPCFYLPDTPDAAQFDFSAYDYVVDAIDTTSAKIDIIRRCKAADVPIISCMGTGNKLSASQFEIVDISKTSVCPLAKVMRKELRHRGITGVKVLYSKEEPIKTPGRTPGSISYVPTAAGLLIAGEVIQDLLSETLI